MTEPVPLAPPEAPPKAPLMPLDEALARLVAVASQRRLTESESVATGTALGRVLAEPVISGLDVPPADNSSMDGYAVRAADITSPDALLPVRQRIAAGAVGVPLQPGTAARIFTGAQIPPGADTVIMQEHVELIAAEGEVPAQIRWRDPMPEPVQAGQWVRRRGEDVQRGSTVLLPGARLTPQALGLAASVGAAHLHVLRRPRVALFSTGDELVMPGDPLPPGAIYNSNRFTLRALLEAAACVVDDLGIVPDRLDATRAALRRAAQGNDLIITSGGVSVGEEDHLKPAVQAEGRLDLWQMAIKPGKPLAFGAVRREPTQAGEALFMGLPGNPVSSFVTFLLAVAPVLRALQGMPAAWPAAQTLRADFEWPRPDKRREFLRVRLNADGGLDLFPNQSSGVLTSAVWGDGLVDNPPGQAIALGDRVKFLLFASLLCT
jgi:molybdopterin molybdotransferase